MTSSNSAPQLQDLIADVSSVQDFPTLSAQTSATQPPAAAKQTAASSVYSSRGYKHDLSESQYPSLSKPAAKAASATASTSAAPTKAKSNPWNSADEEFPSLEGSKPRAHVHGWHLQKPEPKKQSSLTFVNNKRPIISSASDFPTLG